MRKGNKGNTAMTPEDEGVMGATRVKGGGEMSGGGEGGYCFSLAWDGGFPFNKASAAGGGGGWVGQLR